MKSLSPLCWPCREQPLPWARCHGTGMRNPGAETALISLAEPRCGSAALPAPSAAGRGWCRGCVYSGGAGDGDIWSVPSSTEPPWAGGRLLCETGVIFTFICSAAGTSRSKPSCPAPGKCRFCSSTALREWLEVPKALPRMGFALTSL